MEIMDSMETYLRESTARNEWIDRIFKHTLHHAKREYHHETDRSDHKSTILEKGNRREEELENFQEEITYQLKSMKHKNIPIMTK